MRTLVIGNKNYSSWSLRPWVLLTQAGIPFEEKVIALDQPDTAAEIARVSPSGRVPALVEDGFTVWDSIAICEYVAEQFPEKQLWPKDPRARAFARSVSAEMHSGFASLRTQLPMKFKETLPLPELVDATRADIARITALWTECRRRFGQGGPFLFGAFSIADAMYAPVVSRFHTYGVELSGEANAYAVTMWKLPAMQKWLEGAKAENFRMARYEAK